MVQELLTILNHTNSLPVFTGVQVAQSLAFCVVFCRSLFVLFFLSLYCVLLRFMASDYTFDIFKLFLFGAIIGLLY